LGGGGRRILSWRPALAKLVRFYLKRKQTSQKAGGIAEVIEYFSSMHKAAGSIFSTLPLPPPKKK
jgi:hypothetical protein